MQRWVAYFTKFAIDFWWRYAGKSEATPTWRVRKWHVGFLAVHAHSPTCTWNTHASVFEHICADRSIIFRWKREHVYLWRRASINRARKVKIQICRRQRRPRNISIFDYGHMRSSHARLIREYSNRDIYIFIYFEYVWGVIGKFRDSDFSRAPNFYLYWKYNITHVSGNICVAVFNMKSAKNCTFFVKLWCF